MLDDAAIRDAVRRRLRRAAAKSGALLVEELGIDHGRRRADLALMNGCFTGYEIKSDEDSLVRLRAQRAGYDRVFDYSIVVTTQRHLGSVRAAGPDWWGLWVACEGPRGGVRLSTARRPSRWPDVSKIALARLLWRDELGWLVPT